MSLPREGWLSMCSDGVFMGRRINRACESRRFAGHWQPATFKACFEEFMTMQTRSKKLVVLLLGGASSRLAWSVCFCLCFKGYFFC